MEKRNGRQELLKVMGAYTKCLILIKTVSTYVHVLDLWGRAKALALFSLDVSVFSNLTVLPTQRPGFPVAVFLVWSRPAEAGWAV